MQATYHYSEMKLILQSYAEANEGRREELRQALDWNLKNDAIDEVHDLDEQQDVPTWAGTAFIENPKYVRAVAALPRGRMTFKMAIEYAREKFEDGTVFAIANNDIMIDSCLRWRYIKTSFFDMMKTHSKRFGKELEFCLFLSRHELTDGTIKEARGPNSQDTWVFQMSPKIRELDLSGFEFSVGNCWGCDNTMAFLAFLYDLQAVNLPFDFPTYHVDSVRRTGSKEGVIGTSTTDMRASHTEAHLFLPHLTMSKLAKMTFKQTALIDLYRFISQFDNSNEKTMQNQNIDALQKL